MCGSDYSSLGFLNKQIGIDSYTYFFYLHWYLEQSTIGYKKKVFWYECLC